MATILLSVVGGIVAGPIGAGLGAAAGAVIDQQVIGALTPTARREGPRLSDLSVQVSTYGVPIARVYGRARVTGNVIWSTGLKETRGASRSGGKGQRVATTQFSYSISAAIGLCSRAIVGVGRVWADGKLIRDADGALSVGGLLRIHDGREEQEPDPLLEAALGPKGVSAYRGLAYAVIEDMPLAEFGNRLPALAFEVIADPGDAVALATIAADLAQASGLARVDTRGVAGGVTGFVVAGASDSAKSALDLFAELYGLWLRPALDGGAPGVLISNAMPTDLAVRAQAADIGAAADPSQRRAAGATRGSAGATDAPRELSLVYWDPSRDYQLGLQRARRAGATAARGQRREAPLVLAADAAKAAAEQLLARNWRSRASATVALPWRHLALEPGDLLRLPDAPEPLWRIDSLTVDGGALEAELIPVSPADLRSAARAAETPTPAQTSADPGATVLAILELPATGAAGAGQPAIALAASSASPGWRRGTVLVSRDNGADYATSLEVAGASIMGATLTPLAPGPATLWDERNTVDVALLQTGWALENRSAASVLAGANVALVDDELLQFRNALSLGGGRYRLAGLLRGRRGTEWAMVPAPGGHPAGARFLLLDQAGLVSLADPPGVGATLLLKALSPNQSPGAVAAVAHIVSGEGVKPLSPVGLQATRLGDGALQFEWTRRSRLGFDWIDGLDAPLGEESERYQADLLQAGAVCRTWRLTTPSLTYTASEQRGDFGTLASNFTLRVAQLGAAGPGRPAERVFTLV